MTTTLPSQIAQLHSRFVTKLALAAATAVAGDWLLYDRNVGLSLPLFLAALATSSFLMRPCSRCRRDLQAAAILLILSLLPLLEDIGSVSALVGVLGTALAAVVATGGLSRGWHALATSTGRLLLAGPFQLFRDLPQARREMRSEGRTLLRIDRLAGWIIPVLCCAVFVALLASANPLIERWLSVFDFSQQRWRLDPARAFAWFVLLAVAWSFVAVRIWGGFTVGGDWVVPELPDRFFGPAAILRSLILFNLLFSAQSVLDVVYLWGGATLPEGMTYATYAHRGAYPLIVTALLAAAFVLAAMRPGGAGEQSSLIRGLVYVWIGQNVLLVISAILRLELYVATYSLTLLRVAAFIWMLLVAAGLVLIMARIALRRSNGWLVAANLLALALTLYVCSFVNFAALIANHNLSYRREVMPGATPPDLVYIQKLGPHVIPAVDRYIARHGLTSHHVLPQWRNRAALAHGWRMRDWRAWTFRDARLQHYLDEGTNDKGTAAAPAASPSVP